jgi:hypothetical protein
MTGGLFAGKVRKHWHKKLLIRVIYCGFGTFVGVALPFFGDIAALSGALGVTPCTFVYPFWIYNVSSIGQKAPSWKRALNWFLALYFPGWEYVQLLGLCTTLLRMHQPINSFLDLTSFVSTPKHAIFYLPPPHHHQMTNAGMEYS